jgi:glutathione S-transferase
VRLFMAEKGIELELDQVDIMSGENRQDEYLSKNFIGQTPCLELDDGTFISETTVICEYLEDTHPSPALIGSNPQEKAETRMWTRRVGLHIVDPMTCGFRFAEGLPLFKDRYRTIPQAADDLKATAQDGIQALDAQLAGRDFIVGDRFSLADINLFAFLEFGSQVGQPVNPEYKNVSAWYERVNARPSVEASQ